MADIITKKCDS